MAHQTSLDTYGRRERLPLDRAFSGLKTPAMLTTITTPQNLTGHIMKGLIQKLRLPLAALWLTGSVANSQPEQDFHSLTIFLCAAQVTYSSGPSQHFFYEPAEASDGSLDLNRDGLPDFSFHLPYFLCTADVPTSACTGPYQVLPLGTNAVLSQGHLATILGFGAQIGENSLPSWRLQNPAQVVTHYFSERYRSNGLFGPLAEVGVGYLGVRFYAADGVHYGWVRLRLAPFVSVVDWAYEQQPNVPICAGTIGSFSESLQFSVNFRGANGPPPGSIGSFILTGNTLRGELTLAGLFSSAHIAGPAPARAQAKPWTSLGDPLVARSNFTSFLGDTTLSEGQIRQLLRGAMYVSLDGGRAVGQIERSP